MMRVVNLFDEIDDGQLQLVRPQSPCFACRRQFMAGAEIHQNVGALPDQQLAGAQERRRIGRMHDRLAVEQVHQRGHAVGVACGEPRATSI